MDVIVVFEAVDEPAAATCVGAFEREGWSVFRSDGATGKRPRARAYVVIWSQGSIGSARLARESRQPLETKHLLQLLIQPRKSPDAQATRRMNVIEPPEPFCFFQGLPLENSDVDGSERAINNVGHSWSDSEKMLKEVARLGGLKRPCDDWNARIVFSRLRSQSAESFTISEYSGGDGRLLRRFNDTGDGRELRDLMIDGGFAEEDYETAIGNRWCVISQRDSELVTDVVVENPEQRVDLPRRAPWWQRLRRR